MRSVGYRESHPPEKGSDNWILVREVTYEMSFFLRKLKSKVGKAKKEKSTDVIVDGASKFSIKLEQYRGALGIYIIYAIIRPFIEFLARQRLMERCEYTYGFDVTVSELFTFYVTLCGDEDKKGEVFEFGIKPADYVYFYLILSRKDADSFIHSYKREVDSDANKNRLVSFECAWRNFFRNKVERNFKTRDCKTSERLPYNPSKVLVKNLPPDSHFTSIGDPV